MKFKTNVGPLQWTFITGKGSPKYGKQFTSDNLADFEFKASMKVDKKEADRIQKIINSFWNENKPAKIVKPTTTFLKAEMVDSEEQDEYGAVIKKPSGNYMINASTNAAFKGKDGTLSLSKVAVLNAKGKELPETHPLIKGDVGVGEGSTGIIHGSLAITEYEGKAYVKFYLSGVQFAKFVPYANNSIEAEELDVEDDGCGVESDGCDVENISGPEL